MTKRRSTLSARAGRWQRWSCALTLLLAITGSQTGAAQDVRAGGAARAVVTEVGDLHVRVSQGAAPGLVVGDHVQVGARATDATSVPVGRVSELQGDVARVELGLGETHDVALGQPAEPTRAGVTGGIRAPRTPLPMLQIELGARPFASSRARHSGGGALGTMSVLYQGAQPWFARLELAALGAVDQRRGFGTYAALASAGYGARVAALGASAGVAGFRAQVIRAGTESPNERIDYGPVVPRLTLGPLLRLGTLDGLHVWLRATVIMAEGRAQLGGAELKIQAPLSRRVAVAPSLWVAPISGLITGELGVRVLVRGSGGAGSLFVRPAAGFVVAYAPGRAADTDELFALVSDGLLGPMLGADVALRL